MEKPLEKSSMSLFNIIEAQVSPLNQGEGQRSEDHVPLQGPVRLVAPTSQTGANRGTTISLMSKKEKKRRTKQGKIEKNEASSSLAKELKALNSKNASLVSKYDSLARKYDKAIKSFDCVAILDQENERLDEKLGKLNSEHMG
jgi:predicted RNase H-like nuclease (RuvC/YqgF family)